MGTSELVKLGGERILLLGCGRMGFALLSGWLDKGLPPQSVHVVEPSPSDALRSLSARSGIAVSTAVTRPPTIVVVAVKPQAVAEIARQAADGMGSPAIVISIMAGITLDGLATLFPRAESVVRTMPNLAATVGASATALVSDDRCDATKRAVAESLMQAVGITRWVEDEALMDAACAVSGSGPAYAFHLVECLAAAGVAEGLSQESAMALAKQTLVGVGALLNDAAADPADLRQRVTSPGGTTQAGLERLMAGGALEKLVGETVEAAAARSRELGATG